MNEIYLNSDGLRLVQIERNLKIIHVYIKIARQVDTIYIQVIFINIDIYIQVVFIGNTQVSTSTPTQLL